MKGVVLAGGLGTRMAPLTRVVNKQALPVHRKPMIFYPIGKLVRAGIRDVAVVTGGPHAGDLLKLLGNGEDFGLSQIHYAYQRGEGGIAEALGLTEKFVGGDRVCVVLGDNIFEDELGPAVARFAEQRSGARVFLKEVDDPERFGVAEVRDGRVAGIEEKPKRPKSRLAVTGIYMYDGDVFSIVRGLKPSGRGELEITDVNNAYVRRGTLEFEVMRGWWTDAGTLETLDRAGQLVAATPSLH